ncbi:hypothetical protein V1514DRAFT_189326 [Lipomyces japonicus]|uniref:uncharacterized protein n=1 Tax=Lipomyces japonicus TaxID=56871 RepID=UPI0034CD925B
MANEPDVTALAVDKRHEYETRQKYAGLAKGAVAGFGVGIGLNLLARRALPVAYKSVTFRVATVTIPTVGLARAMAERELHHAILRERGVYAEEALAEQEETKNLTAGQKLARAATKHRLSIIFGAWVATVGASGYWITRDKLLTGQQKLVQVRMYAQGLTLALIVLASLASVGHRHDEPAYVLDPKDPTHHHYIHNPALRRSTVSQDHWKEVLDRESK